MNHTKAILKEFEELKGQFVITDMDWSVERLIAIGEDNIDIYYVTWNGNKTTWHTCVGRIIPLKGYILDKHYNEIVRIGKINHCDSPDLFMPKDKEEKQKILKINKQAKEEANDLRKNHKYLTNICWDFN